MPPQSSGQILARLNELFRRPPKLSFEHGRAVRIDYKFPELNRPARLYRAYEQRMMDARDVSAIYQRLAPALKEIFVALHKGTRKFEYGRTSLAEWNEYLRFSGDELQTQNNRRFKITASGKKNWTPRRTINESRSIASHWFLHELIPSLLNNSTHFRHFVVGDPGSGKSTLIKYLINFHWRELKEQKVTFSRFEFMKFMSQWYRQNDNIPHALDDYISYILLRDLITQKYFSLPSGDRYEPALIVKSAKFRDEVEREVDEAFDNSLDPELKTISRQNLITHIVDIVSSDSYEPKRFADIPAVVRIALVANFMKSARVVLILDGLDHISIQDTVLHNDRQLVLNFVLSNLNTITSFRTYYPSGIGLNIEILSVIRESTIGINQNRGRLDVDLGQDKIYRVGEIKPRVATFNAIRRSLAAWTQAAPKRKGQALLISHLLMAAFDATMRIINRSVGSRENFESTYEVFGGNLRTLFDFMRRLLTWFVEESIKDGSLKVEMGTRAESIFSAMVGSAGLQMLRRRKYRVVEILLFSDMPWFENAVTVEQADQLLDLLRGEPNVTAAPIVFENKFFTGVIDNIFNYHIQTHENKADLHCLLEKSRIIQLLSERPLPFGDLNTALHGRFGYRSTSVIEAVVLLIRNESIKFTYSPAEGLRLFATARGRFVMQYLCHEMSYLEHTFHRTLFPRQLVATIMDERRDLGVENWTISSIRNCFIFLTYLNFVESNNANGRIVPAEMRIFDLASRRVVGTLERILRGQEKRNVEGTLGFRALHLIERQIDEWNRAGILINKPKH